MRTTEIVLALSLALLEDARLVRVASAQSVKTRKVRLKEAEG